MQISKIISIKNNFLIKRPPKINRFVSFRGVSQPEFGIDINSRSEFPYYILSNFSDTNFELDGVQINSMEGFLQSLKVKDPDIQKEICLMDGKHAKGMGKKQNKKRNYDFKHLWWQGQKIDRESEQYQDLLKRAYKARYDADEDFQFALEWSKGRVLRHSIGETDPKRTLLTQNEFCSILTELRDNDGDFS